MVPKVVLLVVLLPLALAWPMEGSEKEMMMQFMTKGQDEKNDMMEMMKDDNKDMMMKYMMTMWKKEMKAGHYAGDADGCKKDEDSWKDWAEDKEKKEREEKAKKMMEDFKKFKDFMAQKREMEEKQAEEEKEKMYDLWQKHQEKKRREEKENEFKEMIDSFQNQKHKFAFKLTHEFLQLCQCAEVSEQMEKLSMFEMENGTDLMNNMTSEDAAKAIESGDMGMLALKMSKMSVEEKKKVFMSGLIKSMCTGAQSFIQHAKKFEEMYMMKYNEANSNSTSAD